MDISTGWPKSDIHIHGNGNPAIFTPTVRALTGGIILMPFYAVMSRVCLTQLVIGLYSLLLLLAYCT